MLPVVALTLLLVSAEMVPLRSQPDKLIDSILDSYNDLFSKPNSMPKVRSSVKVNVGKATASVQAVGLYVEGDDLGRLGNSSTYSKGGSFFYETKVDVGGIKFAYNSVTVEIKGKTYNAVVNIPSFRTPVPFVLEKKSGTTACAISTGPFDSDLSQTTLELKDAIRDEETKEIIRQVQKSNTFISTLFLDAFFSTVQDPIFLLIKEYKFCECIVAIKNNC